MRKKTLFVLNILLLGLLVSYIASNRAFANNTIPIHQLDPASVRFGTDQWGFPLVYAKLKHSYNQTVQETCINARNTIYGQGSWQGNVVYNESTDSCYTSQTGVGNRWLEYAIFPKGMFAEYITLNQPARDTIDKDETYGYLKPLTDQLKTKEIDVRFGLTDNMKNNPQNYEICFMWQMSKVAQSHSSAARNISRACQPFEQALVKNECRFNDISFIFSDVIANSNISGLTQNMNYSCTNANTPIKLSWQNFSYDCEQTGIKINSNTANTCVEVKANNNIIRQANAPISMTLQGKSGFIPFSAAIQNQRIASPGTYRGSRQLLISYD